MPKVGGNQKPYPGPRQKAPRPGKAKVTRKIHTRDKMVVGKPPGPTKVSTPR